MCWVVFCPRGLALPVLRELGLLELCKKFLSFAKEQRHSPLEVSKPLGVLILGSVFWLLWRDLVSILESIANKLLFEKWRLRSKNLLSWCDASFALNFEEICYREDAPQHAYNSWGAWLSLLGLWRGRGLYSQYRDHSKQPKSSRVMECNKVAVAHDRCDHGPRMLTSKEWMILKG